MPRSSPDGTDGPQEQLEVIRNSDDSKRPKQKRHQPKVVYQRKSQASTGNGVDNVNVINVNMREAAANSAASSAA